MRFLILVLVLVFATDVRAQSYLERKDADAIGIIERSLAKIDRIPQLFDGTMIPDGVDLQSVKGLHDQLSLHLRAARSGFNDLTPKRAAMTDARTLRAKFDDLERYFAALGPVLSRARANAETRREQQRAYDERMNETARNVCSEFRAEIRRIGETEMRELVYLADGQSIFWQTAEDGAKYKRALEETAAVCKRMPSATESCARTAHADTLEVKYCGAAARADELMKQGVKNLIAHHVEHSGPKDVIADFERYNGYVDVDGVVGWKDYFSGSKVRDMLANRINPMLPQANMTAADAAVLFDGLATEYTELEAKAREAAPKWELPGSPCSGPGCAQAKKFFAQWYRGSAIKRFQHTRPGWKILTNGLGVPTYRERYGFALVQVKGDPFCQLRMWTYSEPYAGGGRYTPGRDVHLHSVRWQSCK